MKKMFVNHDQLTQATPKLREELVEYSKENNVYVWKQDKSGMSRASADIYNLPLFSFGQLLAFLLPKLKGIYIEPNGDTDSVVTTLWFRDEKFGIGEGGELILGNKLLSFEPVDALWGAILHYGSEIEPKKELKKGVKSS